MPFSKLNPLNTPHVHLVLGSGFGKPKYFSEALSSFDQIEEKSFSELGLSLATAPEHKGAVSIYAHRSSTLRLSIQWGRLHLYEGNSTKEVIAPLVMMRSLGVKNFILTNAAGSMIEESSPGDLMLIRDHINFTAHNPLTMRELPNGIIGRFHDMSSVYDADLALGLESQLKYSNFRTHHGVYLGLVGPTFETPAEIKSFAKIGADAVGMSTVLEAIYLKASGARVCGLSLLSNMACGFQSKINERTENSTPKELSATEVFETAERIAPKLAKSLINFITQERTFL